MKSCKARALFLSALLSVFFPAQGAEISGALDTDKKIVVKCTGQGVVKNVVGVFNYSFDEGHVVGQVSLESANKKVTRLNLQATYLSYFGTHHEIHAYSISNEDGTPNSEINNIFLSHAEPLYSRIQFVGKNPQYLTCLFSRK